MRSLGATLRGLRELRGLTQLQLAQRSGVSQATIARMEADASGAVDALERLAAALGCDVETVYLCRRELE